MTKLTKRQNQILELIMNGMSNARIAKELGIKEPTVKMHVSCLFKAKNVKTRLELAVKEYDSLRKIIEKLEG